MKTFEYDGITVSIYQDIDEWTKDFYYIPENAEINNKSELESECMGFACISEMDISIFVCLECTFKEILEVVAHELGHLTTPKFDREPENEDQHEEKAIHYENFAIDAWNVAREVWDIVNYSSFK